MTYDGPQQLRAWLSRNKMTQRGLADDLGIAPETLTRYLNGKAQPTRMFALAVEAMTAGIVLRETWDTNP